MLVRVEWRDGHATVADLAWARSVSELVASAPLALARDTLSTWPDLVLGWYAEPRARQVRADAEARGHRVELLTMADYGWRYVASSLGCAPLSEGELRAVFRPSFAAEGVVTAHRTADIWRVETRVARENLWYARFNVVLVEDWHRVERSPGVDVLARTVPREQVEREERALLSVSDVAAGEPRFGTDGMSVHASALLGAVAFEEDVWSPLPGSRVRAAADLVLRLAWEERPWFASVQRHLR